MSRLRTMTPIASVLVLSVATVACAETTKAPAKAAEQPAKPVMPMEGKCGGNMKMDPTNTETSKSGEASSKAMEGKCGGMK